MAVGDDDALDVVDALAQVGEVGQDEVDADHLGGREAQADVDDERSGRRTRRPSCSCRSPPGRRAAGRAACRAHAAAQQAVARRAPSRSDRRALLVGLDAAAGAGAPAAQAEQLAGLLDRDRVVPARRRVDVLQRRRRSRRGSRARRPCRRISSPTTWLATRMPPAPPMSSDAGEVVVVAGVEVEAVDRREVVVVGLLDALDVRRSAPSSASRSFGMSSAVRLGML